ncbi:glycosyl transferase family 2 [Natronosalvus caseinilyticus]|uniref:glycosyl transferase family 2 n=1 Tax=Natronosalvus caseinilyticus TaxID=2953747 RepID=UPI0028B04180|nr:glycosyl transferase family 2 [Natronosalvus caseinilyticus]
MEYTQERVATLHRLTEAPVGFDGLEPVLERTVVVVPMTDREQERPAATGVLSALESIRPVPERVIVPVRADPDRIESFREWVESFDLPVQVLWCNAPAVGDLLSKRGLDGNLGKGRDVWLALGPATTQGEYVVVHDADATSFRPDHVARLLEPLAMGYDFSKGYYARVENGKLYGRLCRLLYEPLVEALRTDHDDPVVEYLAAFRYALAGEFAMTADLASRLQPPRAWGLEVATLGDAFEHAGFEGSAQVDLGIHRHDHRTVDGESGLEGMSRDVAASILRVLQANDVDVDYETLATRYRAVADRLIDQYGADAAFNDLSYDRDGEREQVTRYARSLTPPGGERRLPPWTAAPVDPNALVQAATPWTPSAPSLESTTQD